jgi:hypothetical protein
MCCEKNSCKKDSGTTAMTGDGPHSPDVFQRRKSSTFAANVFMVTTAIPPAWLRDSQYRDSRAASTTANESSEGTESTVRGKAHSAASSIRSVNRPLSHAALQSQCKKPTADSSTRSLQPSQAGSVEVAIMVALALFPLFSSVASWCTSSWKTAWALFRAICTSPFPSCRVHFTGVCARRITSNTNKRC